MEVANELSETFAKRRYHWCSCPIRRSIGGSIAKSLDKAIENIKALGYNVIETASVRKNTKCVSADPATRAAEFMSLYENHEVAAPDIYRTLWQMRECGWFQYCNGIIIGRPYGYEDHHDFTLIDTMKQGLGDLNVPVLYDADIGHIPPQMQIVNGSMGTVTYADGKETLWQRLEV